MNHYSSVLLPPGVNFDQVRDGRRSPLFHIDVDLSAGRSIAAGTALLVNVAGDSFYADLDPDMQGDAIIHFQDVNFTPQGAPVYVTRGQIVNVPFTQLLIENDAQPGRRLRFFYGVGLDFKPGAASSVNVAGTVSVIDAGYAQSKAGQSFGFAWNAPAVAGFYSQCQLWNPAASGLLLIVESVSMGMGVVPGTVMLVQNAAALTTLVGNGTNKRNGSAVSVAECRYSSNAAASVLGMADNLGAVYVGVAGDLPAWDVSNINPVVLPPGTGLVTWSNQANATQLTMMQWTEETI